MAPEASRATAAYATILPVPDAGGRQLTRTVDRFVAVALTKMGAGAAWPIRSTLPAYASAIRTPPWLSTARPIGKSRGELVTGPPSAGSPRVPFPAMVDIVPDGVIFSTKPKE